MVRGKYVLLHVENNKNNVQYEKKASFHFVHSIVL